MTAPVTLDELGFYTLAGQPQSSRDLVAEVRAGEELGLGTAFISERYNKKEAATLSGAAGAVSDRIRIETAATNHNTRHPIVTAGYARTMQSLTGGRFVLGLGRGITLLQDAFGIPHITTAQMEDFAGIMRRLFRGEVIIGHDGPAGTLPVLHLDAAFDEYLPMGLRRVRTEHARARRPLLRRRRAPHLLHRRDDGSLRRDREGAPPRKRDVIPHR